MVQETQAKSRKTYRTKNNEIFKHLARLARNGGYANAVNVAKSIFYVQTGLERRDVTTSEASELIKRGSQSAPTSKPEGDLQ